MLKISGKNIYIVEFSDIVFEETDYFSWIRDFDNILSIGRIEYLLSMSKNEIKEHIDTLIKSNNDSFFAVYSSIDDVCIGTVKIGHINWRNGIGDVGIMIGNKEYRGKGLSTEIIYLASKYAFETLSIRKLTAGCFSNNIPMKKCFLSVGYKEEGLLIKQILHNGKYIDQVIFGCFNETLIEKPE